MRDVNGISWVSAVEGLSYPFSKLNPEGIVIVTDLNLILLFMCTPMFCFVFSWLYPNLAEFKGGVCNIDNMSVVKSQ